MGNDEKTKVFTSRRFYKKQVVAETLHYMFVSFVIFNLAEIKENMIFFIKPDDRQTKRVLSYKFLTFPRASLNIAKADLFKAIQRSFDVNLISECSI